MDGAASYERALRLLDELAELDSSLTLAQARPSGTVDMALRLEEGRIVQLQHGRYQLTAWLHL